MGQSGGLVEAPPGICNAISGFDKSETLIRIERGTIEPLFGFMTQSGWVHSLCITPPAPDCYGIILTLSGTPDLRGTALRSGDDSSKKPVASATPTSGGPGAAAKVQNKDRDMGAALRTVYQRTVEETIPAEMLDLLGKLD